MPVQAILDRINAMFIVPNMEWHKMVEFTYLHPL